MPVISWRAVSPTGPSWAPAVRLTVAAAASNANLLALSRREIASASVPFVVWELPVVSDMPPFATAFHSTGGAAARPP